MIEAITDAHAASITSLSVSSAVVRFGSETGYVAVTGARDNKARIWAVPCAGDS
jgi:hypothetical protein